MMFIGGDDIDIESNAELWCIGAEAEVASDEAGTTEIGTLTCPVVGVGGSLGGNTGDVEGECELDCA